VGACAGIKLGTKPEPLSRDRSPTEAVPRTAGLFLLGQRHDRDGLTAPTPRPPPTSVSRGRKGSAGAEWPQTEFGEAFFAGRFVGDVALERIAGDITDRGELIDHQPDCRIMAQRLGRRGLVLANLAAGLGNRQSDAARIASPGSTIANASRKRLPCGCFASDMIVVSVRERMLLLTAAARPTAAGWAEYEFIGLYVCTDSIYYAYYIVTIL
jgi:hypothetical protein